MKKLLSLFVALMFVMGLAVVVYADEVVKGKVVSIDPAGKTMVIDTNEGSKTVLLQETTKGVKGVKPGMSVEMTCFDLEGRSCARNIKVISAKEAGKHTKTVEGEVVSIDPEGKSVVIKSPKGKEMTITIKEPPVVEKVSIQKGAPVSEKVTVEPAVLSEVKAGMKVRVECFDSGDGSRAKGNFKRGSDIDLTLTGSGLTLKILLKIENEIDDLLLPYHIDLSIFDEISNPDLIEHIRRVGVVFYERMRGAAAT